VLNVLHPVCSHSCQERRPEKRLSPGSHHDCLHCQSNGEGNQTNGKGKPKFKDLSEEAKERTGL
jgi:hypothetical protein